MSSPLLSLFRLGVPAVVLIAFALDLVSEVAALKSEQPGLAVVAPLQFSEGFGVVRIVSTAPLRLGYEVILHRPNRFAHESLGAWDALGTDFPNVNTLGGETGDLEIIDVGLIVSPAHGEEIADLDRSGSNVLVHCGDRITVSLEKVKPSIVVKVNLVTVVVKFNVTV